jgi:hypothetical protein
MPIVIMRWKSEHRPAAIPHSLIELLRSEAGMVLLGGCTAVFLVIRALNRNA